MDRETQGQVDDKPDEVKFYEVDDDYEEGSVSDETGPVPQITMPSYKKRVHSQRIPQQQRPTVTPYEGTYDEKYSSDEDNIEYEVDEPGDAMERSNSTVTFSEDFYDSDTIEEMLKNQIRKPSQLSVDSSIRSDDMPNVLDIIKPKSILKDRSGKKKRGSLSSPTSDSDDRVGFKASSFSTDVKSPPEVEANKANTHLKDSKGENVLQGEIKPAEISNSTSPEKGETEVLSKSLRSTIPQQITDSAATNTDVLADKSEVVLHNVTKPLKDTTVITDSDVSFKDVINDKFSDILIQKDISDIPAVPKTSLATREVNHPIKSSKEVPAAFETSSCDVEKPKNESCEGMSTFERKIEDASAKIMKTPETTFEKITKQDAKNVKDSDAAKISEKGQISPTTLVHQNDKKVNSVLKNVDKRNNLLELKETIQVDPSQVTHSVTKLTDQIKNPEHSQNNIKDDTKDPTFISENNMSDKVLNESLLKKDKKEIPMPSFTLTQIIQKDENDKMKETEIESEKYKETVTGGEAKSKVTKEDVKVFKPENESESEANKTIYTAIKEKADSVKDNVKESSKISHEKIKEKAELGKGILSKNSEAIKETAISLKKEEKEILLEAEESGNLLKDEVEKKATITGDETTVQGTIKVGAEVHELLKKDIQEKLGQATDSISSFNENIVDSVAVTKEHLKEKISSATLDAIDSVKLATKEGEGVPETSERKMFKESVTVESTKKKIESPSREAVIKTKEEIKTTNDFIGPKISNIKDDLQDIVTVTKEKTLESIKSLEKNTQQAKKEIADLTASEKELNKGKVENITLKRELISGEISKIAEVTGNVIKNGATPSSKTATTKESTVTEEKIQRPLMIIGDTTSIIPSVEKEKNELFKAVEAKNIGLNKTSTIPDGEKLPLVSPSFEEKNLELHEKGIIKNEEVPLKSNQNTDQSVTTNLKSKPSPKTDNGVTDTQNELFHKNDPKVSGMLVQDIIKDSDGSEVGPLGVKGKEADTRITKETATKVAQELVDDITKKIEELFPEGLILPKPLPGTTIYQSSESIDDSIIMENIITVSNDNGFTKQSEKLGEDFQETQSKDFEEAQRSSYNRKKEMQLKDSLQKETLPDLNKKGERTEEGASNSRNNIESTREVPTINKLKKDASKSNKKGENATVPEAQAQKIAENVESSGANKKPDNSQILQSTKVEEPKPVLDIFQSKKETLAESSSSDKLLLQSDDAQLTEPSGNTILSDLSSGLSKSIEGTFEYIAGLSSSKKEEKGKETELSARLNDFDVEILSEEESSKVSKDISSEINDTVPKELLSPESESKRKVIFRIDSEDEDGESDWLPKSDISSPTHEFGDKMKEEIKATFEREQKKLEQRLSSIKGGIFDISRESLTRTKELVDERLRKISEIKPPKEIEEALGQERKPKEGVEEIKIGRFHVTPALVEQVVSKKKQDEIAEKLRLARKESLAHEEIEKELSEKLTEADFEEVIRQLNMEGLKTNVYFQPSDKEKEDKKEKTLKRVERRFERMASEVLDNEKEEAASGEFIFLDKVLRPPPPII